MKNIVLVVVVIIAAFSCNQSNKQKDATEVVEVVENKTLKQYPEALSKVFNAHGGVDKWQRMHSLSFQFEGSKGYETHTTSLKDRKSLISHKDWSIGYDGKDVWLLQNEEDAYTGNARFYHNLMFYFYAMPFVLADDGINYSNVPETELNGTLYKGIKISYKSDVGDSPEDEYILYYNPDTYQMEWLAYTVTYNSNKKSDRWSFIKYKDWVLVSDILLPKALEWFTVEDNKPKEPRNERLFNAIKLSETVPDKTIFNKPPKAIVVER